MTSIVKLNNLRIDQGPHPVLQHVSLEIMLGELVYLIGKTGQGKTSLLKTLYADLPIGKHQADQVIASVADHDLLKLPTGKIASLRKNLGIIFQDFQLFFDRSVAENLIFVMQATGWTDRSKMKHRLAEVLMQVGLGTVSNKMPYQLSGGEQQMLAMARILRTGAKLLLLDEITEGLAPVIVQKLGEVVTNLRNKGFTIVLVEQNFRFAAPLADRHYVVEHGNVVEVVNQNELTEKASLLNEYLGV
jgi:branched-chain amino acid transport system ATP-binding protein